MSLPVGTDTLTAVERAEDVVRPGGIPDARTVERVGQLVAEHADVGAMGDLEDAT